MSKLKLKGTKPDGSSLTFVQETPGAKEDSNSWKCRCDCGKYVDVNAVDVLLGKVTSCGCRKLSSSEEGKVLIKMLESRRDACYNKKSKLYPFSGGLGAKVYSEWLNNPKSFILWAYASGYSAGKRMIRIDNYDDYCPYNCIWIPGSTSWKTPVDYTKRDILTYAGETKTLQEWSEISGISAQSIAIRLTYGKWPVGKAIHYRKGHMEALTPRK